MLQCVESELIYNLAHEHTIYPIHIWLETIESSFFSPYQLKNDNDTVISTTIDR